MQEFSAGNSSLALLAPLLNEIIKDMYKHSEKSNQGFNHSPAELKHAYKLVTDDLYHSLVKMKDGQSLRWNKLGKFTKKVVQARSGLDGNTHIYYRVNFSPFATFKKTLNQSLEHVR